MTIMLAGGMVIAAPGMEPAHAANANLIVSAENSIFGNSFAGPMVIEVVVKDSNYDETNEAEGEPDVTVNGEDLRMVQATDGNWYAYIAEDGMVTAAELLTGTGLDFGEECTATQVFGSTSSGGATRIFVSADSCTTTISDDIVIVKKAKNINPGNGGTIGIGQIGVADELFWPFVQTFKFAVKGDVKIEYAASGNVQTSVLQYLDDNSDYVTMNRDRADGEYPQSAQVHLTITDQMLNIDPTSEDAWTFNGTNTQATYYDYFTAGNGLSITAADLSALNFEKNGIMVLTPLTSGSTNDIEVANNDYQTLSQSGKDNFQITFVESSVNSGVFENTDDGNVSNLRTTSDAPRGTSALVDYNNSESDILISFFNGKVEMIEIDDEWNSGEALTVQIIDEDVNKNTKIQEDIELDNPQSIIPTLRVGSPITLANTNNSTDNNTDRFSDRFIANLTDTSVLNGTGSMTFIYDLSYLDFLEFTDGADQGDNYIFSLLNYDFSSTKAESIEFFIANNSAQNSIHQSSKLTDLVSLDTKLIEIPSGVSETSDTVLVVTLTNANTLVQEAPVVMDFLRFGVDDNTRYNDAIYRLLAEESTVSSGIFEGTIEYVMLNQINIGQAKTYENIDTIDQDLVVIAHEDLTVDDALRVNYLDVDRTGSDKGQSDQVDAPSHSATVSFDGTNYKVGDTVTITLIDADLNTDTDITDIYTIPSGYDVIGDGPLILGDKGLGQLLEITFDDNTWKDNGCTNVKGFEDTAFTLRETSKDSGIFVGDFQIPGQYCEPNGTSTGNEVSVSGLDLAVNYIDFRDASGEEIEVGDSAGIGASTGSVSFDRTVYPVPFGVPSDFGILANAGNHGDAAVFPIHATSISTDTNDGIGAVNHYVSNGDLQVHIRINDPDFDISASGTDEIALTNPPVIISVTRGAEKVILATAGGEKPEDGVITEDQVTSNTIELGPITEIAPDAGIFELDMTVRYTDGPTNSLCPETEIYTPTDGTNDSGETTRFAPIIANDGFHCILQGDILQVEYTDPTDASGDANTVTDSATFDLRNGVLQADKSVYIIGSDMILTLIEPDLDLDNDQAETYTLDIIEWDSDADTLTMGPVGDNDGAFDPEPSAFRETGDSTGIFQVVAEIPAELDNDPLERGEQIDLEYTDWGPSGANYVGDNDEDVQLTIFTSNFGATIELDQKVYTWTDKVYITIVAPDHNFDNNSIDEIGNSGKDPIKVSTRGNELDDYKLVETGTDTGIFTGEVILTGFQHDADGDRSTGTPDNGYDVTPKTGGNGPTSGFLAADNDDGLTVSFEFSEDDSVIGSALIRWNIGEVQWLEASYPASGTGVVRVIDPDMNLDPEAVNNFNIDVWSDSDAGGIDLTITETNEATGIFEGTVFFTTTDQSSGHRLRVAEGDTVTAEYEDNTLPDPYSTADELDISATTLIGTIVPPLERAPAANLRTVDAFGNSLDTVSVDQQVQISADLSNGQDRVQDFAYLVQIQDGDGVTVSLAWITGSLSSGQSFSPALSWIPTTSGSYTATAFVWESVDNPTALSPPVSTTISVS